MNPHLFNCVRYCSVNKRIGNYGLIETKDTFLKSRELYKNAYKYNYYGNQLPGGVLSGFQLKCILKTILHL